MSDLVLEIAPGCTVRGFLAPDQPDTRCTVFSIFEFLDAVVRRHKPNSKPGGGFAQAYWQRVKHDPLLVHVRTSVAHLRAASGRGRYPFQVTTAAGLACILAFAESKLRELKKQSTPQPEPSWPALQRQMQATVAHTLQRFLAGDSSMLREIHDASTPANNAAPQASLSDHEHQTTPNNTVSNDVAQPDVFFRFADHVVMGTHHPGVDEPVFSVYSFIDITRNKTLDHHRFYYTRRIWEDASKKKLSFVSHSVMANIRCNPNTKRTSRTPALPMSKLQDIVFFLVRDAKDKVARVRDKCPYRGMWKHKLYQPICQNILLKLGVFFRKYEQGDKSMIKNVD
jgi:hypothetical protein